MEKMIKLSSYVELISNGHEDDRDKLMSITDYTGLIKEPPTLSMFIPCDDDGDPIVNKVISVKRYEKQQRGLGMTGDALEELVDQYENALEDVMFEGWSLGANGFLVNEFGGCIGLKTDKGFKFLHNDGDIIWETVEQIISDFTLTPNKTCIKKHGLPEKVAA